MRNSCTKVLQNICEWQKNKTKKQEESKQTGVSLQLGVAAPLSSGAESACNWESQHPLAVEQNQLATGSRNTPKQWS